MFELAVPENVQFGAVPPDAGKTASRSVDPLKETVCRSGVGPTADPGFDRNEIEVPLLPAWTGTMWDVTHEECSTWTIRVIAGRTRESASTRLVIRAW